MINLARHHSSQTMKFSLFLFSLAALLTASAAPSPVTPPAGKGNVWDYDRLTTEADLVVVATPLSAKELDERTFLPGIQQLGPDGKAMPIAAVGLETNFEINVILKGQWAVNRLILHHLREANPPAQPAVGGPLLVSFDPKKKIRYLMFLKLDKEGRFYSVTGQTDPGIGIKELGASP